MVVEGDVGLMDEDVETWKLEAENHLCYRDVRFEWLLLAKEASSSKAMFAQADDAVSVDFTLALYSLPSEFGDYKGL